MKKLGIAVLALLMVLAVSGCTKRTPEKVAVSTKAPAAAEQLSQDEDLIASYAKQLLNKQEVDFTLTDLNGKQWKLSDLKGKIVLLNFWATWCGPCQMEMPDFQSLYGRFGADGSVIVIAVSSAALEQGQTVEESKDTVSQFVKKQNFTFPVLFDADGKVWGSYQQQGIPANYIIDTQGNVRLLQAGAFQDESHLYAALEAVRRAESGK